MSDNAIRIARVALDVPVPHLFDYRADGLTREHVGMRVVVPFGKKRTVGVIVEVSATSEIGEQRLRPVEKVLDETAPLSPDWLKLARFASDYYHKPLGEVVFAALPPRLRKPSPMRPVPQPPPSQPGFVALHTLTPDQQGALNAAASGSAAFGVTVLFGITGSGKTEVYLQLIARTLEARRQALVLVPEIALTPALETAFRERFPGARFIVQTSATAAGERARGWLEAQSGGADIVLGTRLAVFAALPRLGLVVVDEEQDASFKQQEGLRYSARDLAIVRARAAGAPVILCSATPSLETFHHASTGRYRLIELGSRAVAQARLPAIHLIDVREHAIKNGFSAPLLEAIAARLGRGEQSLVFLNRRGYAPVLACPACGWVSGCPRCTAHLVLHLRDARLRCHHCGLAEGLPRACPQCGNVDLQPFGRGTQRIESALAERFPEARVLRIDSDAAHGKSRLESLLEHAREADILVGTQILAKGHHFERLTLIGILNADAGLFSSDYRASERMFSQLQQVAGRAGRAGLPGEALVQTRYPHHLLYQFLAGHDFAGFARSLLAERRQAGFPPFVYEAALRAESPDAEAAVRYLRAAVKLAPGRAVVTLFDPAPMSLARLGGLERAQVLMQSPSRPKLQAFLKAWTARLYEAPAQRVRWHIDVDPTEF